MPTGLRQGPGQVFGLESLPGQNVEGATLPPNVQASICNLQLKILACIKIKIQVCTQLSNALSACNNEVPTSNLIPSYLIPTWLQGGVQLPTPQQELSVCGQNLTMNKLRFAQQQPLVYSLFSQLPKGQALTPSQVMSLCNNEASNLMPHLQSQALTSCLNELQNQLAQNVPSALTPSQLYPQHLKLCILIKIQLEYVLMQAANLSSQLQNNPSSQLQSQLSQCQTQAQQLQQQYNGQKSVCIALKALTLCQGQIQNLMNQVNNLMGGKPFPGYALYGRPGTNVFGL